MGVWPGGRSLGPHPGEVSRGGVQAQTRGGSQHALRQTPPPPTAYGGTHSTGMHSCSIFSFIFSCHYHVSNSCNPVHSRVSQAAVFSHQKSQRDRNHSCTTSSRNCNDNTNHYEIRKYLCVLRTDSYTSSFVKFLSL